MPSAKIPPVSGHLRAWLRSVEGPMKEGLYILSGPVPVALNDLRDPREDTRVDGHIGPHG